MGKTDQSNHREHWRDRFRRLRMGRGRAYRPEQVWNGTTGSTDSSSSEPTSTETNFDQGPVTEIVRNEASMYRRLSAEQAEADQQQAVSDQIRSEYNNNSSSSRLLRVIRVSSSKKYDWSAGEALLDGKVRKTKWKKFTSILDSARNKKKSTHGHSPVQESPCFGDTSNSSPLRAKKTNSYRGRDIENMGPLQNSSSSS
ncbi:MAG: hypothetical protein M1837_005138 [Sclerophora amabilis]|nr:MAG: hypothetical protein M1837_005138 [Sclerophora amabilis]